MKKIIIGAVSALFAAAILVTAICASVHFGKLREYTSYSLSDIPEKDRNLMIVAHPDDEMLFGGAHLLEGDYLIIVVTAGRDFTRAEELKALVERTGDDCIMLGYPDKTHGKRDDWSSCREKIEDNISEILACRDWDTIVTHNPDGEYGHIHHKMTSEIVTGICEDADVTDRLFYFGKYYKKKDIGNETDPVLPEDVREEKRDILFGIYASQTHTLEGLIHIADYESFQSYGDIHEESN